MKQILFLFLAVQVFQFNPISSMDLENVESFETIKQIEDLNHLRDILRNYKDYPELELKHETAVAKLPVKDNYACAILLYNFKRSNNKLFQAILFGDKEAINKILKKRPKLINKPLNLKFDKKSLPLSWAVLLKDIELIELLLMKYADIHKKDSCGLTPLEQTFGDTDLKQFMLKNVKIKK